MKKFMKILAVILAVPVSLFIAICCWCIYDVVLTDNWENYTKTEEYKMKQEQRRIEEEKQAELEKQEQEKKESVKEEPKKEEKKVEEKQETKKVEEKKETVKEEPKKENKNNDIYNKFRDLGEASINEDVVKDPAAYMDEDFFRECVYTLIYGHEWQFSTKPYDGLSREEGRRAMIEGAMEKLDVVLDDSVDELVEMVTIMIDNKFTTIEEYNEFMKTPEEKQADKNLLEEMKEFAAQIAITEANKYEPVEEWEKESTGRNCRNTIHLILHNSLINEFPEASEEQRMEAINYAKEVFVENFPTIEE